MTSRYLTTVLLAVAMSPAWGQVPEALTAAQPGEMPVILTAPHGGREDVPGCELRARSGQRFVTAVDRNTDRLALAVAAELKRLTGKQPYIVVARFHRKYIDANRARAEAYGSPGCQPQYDAYHAAIRRYVDEIRGRYPHGVLLDLHGQAAYPDSVLRGTRHGLTVARLIARAGTTAINGVDSVFGRLAAMGYAVVPPNGAAPDEQGEAPRYSGGHTVAAYGSQNTDGVDAIQIELGLDLRRDAAAVERTAQDLARAIAAFRERFLD